MQLPSRWYIGRTALLFGGEVGDGLTAYLAEHVAHKERRPEQVRVELLARCRMESIEPPIGVTGSWRLPCGRPRSH
ncbi:hypothetical protein [Streptomyces avermitilis]|uniref:hypothetical protein n=1 Tax=Streptomyces avermitilis TaxID=33903 RepID=UPI0038166DB7